MKKPGFFLLLLLFAVPSFAQYSGQSFWFLIGGSGRLYSGRDRTKAENFCTGQTPPQPSNCVDLPSGRLRFGDRDVEVFYAVQLEPSTHFKIRAGQMNTDVGVIEASNFVPPQKGHIQHADGIVQYDFSEPFGKTGLFAGLGLYRWSGGTIPTDTNYGYTFGVNADFPITRKYGFVAEGSYHWINMSSPVRYVTLTGGLRFNF